MVWKFFVATIRTIKFFRITADFRPKKTHDKTFFLKMISADMVMKKPKTWYPAQNRIISHMIQRVRTYLVGPTFQIVGTRS